jgi:hypothetical protein
MSKQQNSGRPAFCRGNNKTLSWDSRPAWSSFLQIQVPANVGTIHAQLKQTISKQLSVLSWPTSTPGFAL